MALANGRILFEIAVTLGWLTVHQARQQLDALRAAPLKPNLRVPVKSPFGTSASSALRTIRPLKGGKRTFERAALLSEQ